MRKAQAACQGLLSLSGRAERNAVGVQARWWDENALLMLPRMEESGVQLLASRKLASLLQLLEQCLRQPAQARAALEQALGSARAADECMQVNIRPPVAPSVQEGIERSSPVRYATWEAVKPIKCPSNKVRRQAIGI